MPKLFAQFSFKDLHNIESIIIDTVKLPLHRRSDINDEVAVLEYSETKDIEKDIDVQHNEAIADPQKTINIFSPDFRVGVDGFNEKDATFIYEVIDRYLINNDFI